MSPIADDFGITEYLMLSLFGDSAVQALLIRCTWQIVFLEVFIALSVSAIVLTLLDSKLFTSPRLVFERSPP